MNHRVQDRTWFRLGSAAETSREHIGGKAFGIHGMLARGLPVPPAFVLGTDECRRFNAGGKRLGEDVKLGLRAGMAHIEDQLGRSFGGTSKPLLVSVRSGAPQSMPGMMDTVLNLGINDATAHVIGRESGNTAYANDTLRRFREQYLKVVGTPPPDDPWDQLEAAVRAVFSSWDSPRATAYRAHHGMSHAGGTAVTIQAMVFGNADEQSGTGVLFTRSPVAADSTPLGEWVVKGQGEDIVSGRVKPEPLSALAEQMPEVHRELMELATSLETLNADVQDIEFTVESGRLWLLQTRAAKRSARAAVHHAVSFAREGLISADEALSRLTVEQLRLAVAPRVTLGPGAKVLARGEVGCPGVAHGVAVGTADEAEDLADGGADVILVRPTTDPDDVHGMIAARAVLTEIGGATSHAAVVSRELETPCVVGCGVGSLMHLVGREITVDACSGQVLDGTIPAETPTPETDPDLAVIMEWLMEDSRSDHPLASVLMARRDR